MLLRTRVHCVGTCLRALVRNIVNAVNYPLGIYFYGYGINFISQRVTFLSFLNHATDASGLPPVDKQDILYTFPDGIGSPDE